MKFDGNYSYKITHYGRDYITDPKPYSDDAVNDTEDRFDECIHENIKSVELTVNGQKHFFSFGVLQNSIISLILIPVIKE